VIRVAHRTTAPRASSPAQYEAFGEGTLPRADQVRDGIWSVPMRMPGRYIPYSFCYLIADESGGIHVLDAGWHSPENEQSLTDGLAALGAKIRDVRSVLASHLHPDHIGMANWVVEQSGAELVLHEAEQRALDRRTSQSWADLLISQMSDWEVPPSFQQDLLQSAHRLETPFVPKAERLIRDGDELPIPGRSITVMHTPGHTAGHVCLFDASRGLLFSGDHLMPTIHGGLGLGGETESNPLADYLRSLARVKRLGDIEVAPGHEYRFFGVEKRCNSSAHHHTKRSREVIRELRTTPNASVWQIASNLTWSAGWENLSGFYLQSALSQTAMHIEFARSPEAPELMAIFEGADGSVTRRSPSAT
jgi:glyoxylase-like metal-dependent hydrolase (beta-lactamase superfamily II)